MCAHPPAIVRKRLPCRQFALQARVRAPRGMSVATGLEPRGRRVAPRPNQLVIRRTSG
jgi:hypothetical protein